MDELWQDSQPTTPSEPEGTDGLGNLNLGDLSDLTDLTETTTPPPTPTRTKKDTSLGYELYLNVRNLVFVLAALILIFTFVVRIIVVSGSSMENTLQNGDSMLVWCLGYEPKQGDIVVLTQRSDQEDSLVKRVIATEGQRVDIDYDTGTVYVDGTPLEEDYIKEAMKVPNYGEGVNHVTVPEGYIFVMGDNRNNSADSRYPSIGIIDTRSVIGRAVMVLFPFQDFTLL